MNVWKEINWFAIHTNARRENFAATNIGALGAEVLVPRLKVERLVRGIIRTVTKPLFPGYFFARFSPVLLLDLIRSSRGVLRIVSAGRLPLPLDDDIIPAVRARMDEEGCVRLQQRPLLPGDRVRVEQGPLQGMIGQTRTRVRRPEAGDNFVGSDSASACVGRKALVESRDGNVLVRAEHIVLSWTPISTSVVRSLSEFSGIKIRTNRLS